MESFPSSPKKPSSIKKWLTTSSALVGAATIGYFGTHQEKKGDAKENTKGLADLSPAKYADMQSRIQSELITGYWAKISADKDPSPQNSEARARQIIQLSGFKDAFTAPGMSVIYNAGVPVEIKINGTLVPINADVYSEIELSRINGDNLKIAPESLNKQSTPPEEKKSSNTGKTFISNSDDF